ncbi:MAG: hypothetical protein KJ749_10880, partial [Planctomycetes bacterium]|nr:hypothetical protein [Planctomycetota bacterium]
HMITTLAGPAVNVVICVICAIVLILWLGGLGAVPWNPLHPFMPINRSLVISSAQVWLLTVYGLSYFLLLINLLPVFPFDGGRVLQAWLWPRKGYGNSMLIATATGMIGAVVIGLIGLFLEESWLLLMITVFGYMTCYQTRRMLREQGELAGAFGSDFGQQFTRLDDDRQAERKPGPLARWRVQRAAKKAECERQQEAAHERAVEAALRKVADCGLTSLTARERQVLEKETERQRRVNS